VQFDTEVIIRQILGIFTFMSFFPKEFMSTFGCACFVRRADMQKQTSSMRPEEVGTGACMILVHCARGGVSETAQVAPLIDPGLGSFDDNEMGLLIR
jgi:hypothetical protein